MPPRIGGCRTSARDARGITEFSKQTGRIAFRPRECMPSSTSKLRRIGSTMGWAQAAVKMVMRAQALRMGRAKARTLPLRLGHLLLLKSAEGRRRTILPLRSLPLLPVLPRSKARRTRILRSASVLSVLSEALSLSLRYRSHRPVAKWGDLVRRASPRTRMDKQLPKLAGAPPLLPSVTPARILPNLLLWLRPRSLEIRPSRAPVAALVGAMIDLLALRCLARKRRLKSSQSTGESVTQMRRRGSGNKA